MHPLFQQYEMTLLGRIKAHEMSKLSGSMDSLPSKRAFYRKVFRVWKSNPLAGLFYFKLLDCSQIDRVQFPAHFAVEDVHALLKKLNRDEYFERVYTEGHADRVSDFTQFGCLILGHRRPNGEPGYYAAIYSEKDYEHFNFCSFVPDGTEGKGEVAALTHENWKTLSVEDIANHLPVRIMLASLRHHLDKIECKKNTLVRYQA